MKKILFATLFFVISFSCYAQIPKFMDIPIDGSLENFDVQLQNIGFSKTTKLFDFDNEMTYEGECWGHKTQLTVETSPLSKIVYGIRLFFVFDSEQEQSKFYESQIKTRFLKYKIARIEDGPNERIITFNGKNEHVFLSCYTKEGYRKYDINHIFLGISNNKNFTKSVKEASRMPRVSIPIVEQVHNIKNEDEKGMNINLKFVALRMKGHTIKAEVLFYYEDNFTQLKDTYGNHVSVSKTEAVTSKDTNLSMTLLMPYQRLNMAPNWNGTLSFDVALYDETGKELARRRNNRFTFSNF